MKKLTPYLVATALLSSCITSGTNQTTCPEVEVDTVHAQCPEMDSLSWKFSFNSLEAMAKFKSEIEAKLSELMDINSSEVDTNKEIKISYIPTSGINLQDTTDYVIVTDTSETTDSSDVETVAFDSAATISILSPLPYHYSPFKTLAVDTSISNIKVNRQGNITTLSLRPASMGNSNSIDIIEFWTRFLTTYPAAGKAILGELNGLSEAANGSAKSIKGLSPSSMNAISLATSFNNKEITPADVLLLPAMSSKYVETGTPDNTSYEFSLSDAKPYAKKVSVNYSESVDPVISYSMKKSDAVVLYKKSNMADIKRRSSADAIEKIDQMNLFLAVNSNLAEDLREQISSKATPIKLMQKLDVQGEVISRITKKDESIPYNFGGNVFAPSESKLKLIYPTNNPIAAEVAAALSYHLNQSGIGVELINTPGQYENALFSNSYDIALGAINESELQIKSIEDYIANYWFNGEKNEVSRITNFIEIPLFSVSIFLAMQDGVKIYKQNVKQIYKEM